MNDLLHGVDPVEPSVTALVRAADEAARRRLRLVVAVPPVHDRLGYDALGHRSALRTRAESALSDVRELAGGSTPTFARARNWWTGHRPPSCSRASAADLVVLGSRRYGVSAHHGRPAAAPRRLPMTRP